MPLEPSITRLAARELGLVLDALERSHRRQLADNPDGHALVARALRRAFGLGLSVQSSLYGLDPHELRTDDPRAWERWRRARDETPEASAWPAALERDDPRAVERAGAVVAAAAADLGLRSWDIEAFRRAGAQAAEAGAALVRAVSGPDGGEDADADAEPAAARPAAPSASRWGDAVRVAGARDEAQADLIQGLLRSAGIPSITRMTGPYRAHNVAGGHREIYVPAAAADEARAVLTTFDGPAAA